MNEDFIHYAWKFQKFSTSNLKTTTGQNVQVVKVGTLNTNAGPDFLFGEVVIDQQLWAGTVEIHVQSSHWYVHGHENDLNYDTVILHVVWEHDAEVYRKNGALIPVLEVKNVVATSVLESYRKLFSAKNRWINCESDIALVGSHVMYHWVDRLFLERLERKTLPISIRLEHLSNDWEATLFEQLALAFGLKINGSSFLSIAQSVDFTIVRRLQSNALDLESLFMGQAGWLEKENDDVYYKELKSNYRFLKAKFKLVNDHIIIPNFFRLRPRNFPSLRLSQLAQLLSSNGSFFSEILKVRSREGYASMFTVKASEYWDTHYTFGVQAKRSEKKLTKSFIDLLIINAIIPIKLVYAKSVGVDISEEIIALAQSIKGEHNTIVTKYRLLYNFENNALTSQALLQLKNEYCDVNRCLHCEIGNALLKNTST